MLGGLFFTVQNASAGVAYESLPSANSNHISKHGVGGPVLADDFTSVKTGWVTTIEWWGSAPVNTSGTDTFEVTFHPDVGGSPDTALATAKLSQHFVNATGTDLDNDGIYHYSADWVPRDLFLVAGTTYWFSVANNLLTWTWATGNAPTVGSEQYDAMVSTGIGPDGGPHFGPWTGISGQDFAFRITVPEPATLGLFAIGIAGIGSLRHKRSKI